MLLRILRPGIAVIVLAVWLLSAGCYFLSASDETQLLPLTTVTTFSAHGGDIREPFGIAARDGEIYVSDGDSGTIHKLAADGTTRVIASGLSTPSGIAFLPDGDLVVADTGSHTIKKVDMSGRVTLFAGLEDTPGSADGPASHATFNGPVGIAADTDGVVYIADTYNDRIRVIRGGVVSTYSGSTRGFADGPGPLAKFDTPLGLALLQDKLLVADSGNRRLRVVDPSGDVWTLSGTGEGNLRDGTLAGASFVSPTAVTIAESGEVFVADGNAIRAIGRGALPFVETIAGDRRGYLDGHKTGAARFNRPSGLAVGPAGELLVADSDNRAVRAVSDGTVGHALSHEQIDSSRMKPEEFRALQPARWPYDPPQAVREVAGTLGEIRGEVVSGKPSWFHNGLDIAGGYGEVARFLRTEVVLDPHSAQHFETARELLRLPTIGYIHVRLGRDSRNIAFGDRRFIFDRDGAGKPVDVRVPRGARFAAGEPLGTLNSQNHVHLIAGRAGSEMNALAALDLPGISDTIVPTIGDVAFHDPNWREIETDSGQARIKLGDKFRVIVRAHDRMDGNADRRRLGVYRVGYEINPGSPSAPIEWKIIFDRMPSNDAVAFVYAPGSRSGATGGTVFNYIATNRVSGDDFAEGFIDTVTLGAGKHVIRVHVADFFGNTASRDISFEVLR